MRQIEVSRTWCSTSPVTGGRSSKRSWPTTSTSAAPRGGTDLRPPPGAARARKQTTGVLPPGSSPARRCHHQRRLQALLRQGVLQGSPRCASKPSINDRRPRRAARLPHLTSCRHAPVTSTAACWTMNTSVRVASSRVQPLSGSRRPSLVDGRRAPALRFGDPRSWPWPAPSPSPPNLVGGFSNKTSDPSSPDCSARTTRKHAAATTCAACA